MTVFGRSGGKSCRNRQPFICRHFPMRVKLRVAPLCHTDSILSLSVDRQRFLVVTSNEESAKPPSRGSRVSRDY